MTVGAAAGGGDAARGIICMTASFACFAAMDAIAKWLAGDYPASQLVFFRGVFAMLPIGWMVMRNGGLLSLRTRRPWDHLARGLIGLVSIVAYFMALGRMPLADCVALSFTGPLFLTALSVPLLREYVGPRRWLAVVVGFAGVLVILRPGMGVFGWEAALPIGSALAYALAMIMIRRLVTTESPVTICFYTMAVMTAGSTLFAPFEWVAPRAADWPLFVALGIVGGAGNLLVTYAFRLAPAAVVAPFSYTQIVWAIPLGLVLFGELPDAAALAGAAVVIGAGLYIFHRETLAARRPAGY
jgi:drug/metabolite transporter (DMT)-like permease